MKNKAPSKTTTPETFAIKSLIAKGCVLYNYNRPSMVLDRNHTVLAANFLATRLIDNLLKNSPKVFKTLATNAFGGGPDFDDIQVADVKKNISLKFTAKILDNGQSVYLVQESDTPSTVLKSPVLEGFKNLIDTSNNFLWETNEKGHFSFISEPNRFGYESNELLGKSPREIMNLEASNDAQLPFITKTVLNNVEINLIKADGTVGVLLTSAIPFWTKNNQWNGARGIGRDVTSDRQRDAELSTAQNKERILQYIMGKIREPDEQHSPLESATQAITKTLATDGCQIFKFDQHGNHQSIAVDGHLPFSITKQLKQGIFKDAPLISDNPPYRFAAYVTKYHNKANGILILWGEGESKKWGGEDLSLFQQASHLIGIELQHLYTQERLENLSTEDPLTGLLNRRTFTEILERKIKLQTENQDFHGILAYIDLDNFKLINDQMGHQTGDEVLIIISNQLKDLVNTNDLVARLGGDEFAIWFDRISAGDVEKVLSPINQNQSLFSKFSPDPSRPFSLSIGKAEVKGSANETLSQIIAKADAAMYVHKRSKKQKQ